MKMPRINLEYRKEAQKKIIAAAIEVAGDHGWDGVTLDAIAREVGVTKPALYGYFKNREELLHEIVRGVISNFQSEFETRVAHENDPEQIVRQFAEVIFDEIKTSGKIFFLLSSRYAENPEYREEITRNVTSYQYAFRDCLILAQSKGFLSQDVDPEAAAYMITTMTMGVFASLTIMNLDTDVVKKIWIDAAERFLLIPPYVKER
jgi:AcrR family transcriptional regulator